MTIPVGQYEVTIKNSLTWGDMQEVQKAMASGAKVGSTGLTGYDATAMIEAKYRLLEIAIVGINDGDKTLPFSRDWMNALPIEEGDRLYEAVDVIGKKK
jgi:hypothetical protein